MTARPAEQQAALAEVGRTAFGAAAARATESARPDRLFADPLAGLLLDAGGRETRAFWTEGEGARLSAAMGDYIALRTRYFDDRLGAAVGAGCRQLVLLAAGLDTRGFRLGWPAEMHVYELDQPAVLGLKQSVLNGVRPTCARTAVGVDLREDWRSPLLDAGFRPELPTCWLVEGLLVYLTSEEADQLLGAVGALSGPDSRLAVEHVNRPTLEAARAAAGASSAAATPTALLASLWRNDMTANPVSWLAGHGWRAESHDLTRLAAEHGRPVPPVFDPARPGTARISLLSADRSPEGTT